MDANRIKAMLKYLPCRAVQVPLNLRKLGDAEREGLATFHSTTCLWTLTPKGQAFMDGSLKAPKARRFA